MALFKGAVSQDFLAFFIFHESKPSGPPGKQAKIVLLKSFFREKFPKNLSPTLHRLTLREVGLCALRRLTLRGVDN